MSSEPIIVAQGGLSTLRELERVLKDSELSPQIVTPPDFNPNS